MTIETIKDFCLWFMVIATGFLVSFVIITVTQ
jgi:hypothetical protein